MAKSCTTGLEIQWCCVVPLWTVLRVYFKIILGLRPDPGGVAAVSNVRLFFMCANFYR